MPVHPVEQRLKASVPKGRPRSRKISGYMPRSHQKDLRELLVPENDKTCPDKKKISLHCIRDSQKDERKRSGIFQETPVKCSNDSEASREEHPFVE